MIFWYLKSPRGILRSLVPAACAGIAGISLVLTHSRPSHLSLTVVLDSIELYDAWDERCEKGVTSTMEETKLFFKLNERFETFEYT